jgi:transposase
MADQMAALVQGQVIGTQPLRVGLIPIVHQILEDLDFPRIVETYCGDHGDVEAWKVLEAYVHSRLESADPVPLSGLEAWVNKTTLPHVLDSPSNKLNEFRFGRVLENAGFAPRGLWLELVQAAHRLYKLDLSWNIYDITSFYFEGEYRNSDLAEYGYNRDGKPGTKQINVGLTVTGEDSVALLYNVLPGSTEDGTTVGANLQEVKKLYKQLGASMIAETLGDRAMLNAKLVHLYRKARIDFVGSMKACNVVEDVIESIPTELLLQNPIDYVALRHAHLSADQKEEERYYGFRTSTVIPPHDEVPRSKQEMVPVLVVLAAGKKRLDAQHRETLLKKKEQRFEEIRGFLNTGKYAKRKFALEQLEKARKSHPATTGMLSYTLEGDDRGLSLTWIRNDDVITKAADQDGKYAVFFSNASHSDKQVFYRFKSRDRVEKRADDVKGTGPVVVRPVYLHKDERIEGLILCSMIALLVSSLAQLLIKRHVHKILTGEGLQKLFADFGASLQTLSDHSQLIGMPAADKWQGQVLEAVKVKLAPVAPVALRGRWSNLQDAANSPPPGWRDERDAPDIPDS